MKFVCPELEKLTGNEAIIKALFDPQGSDLAPYDTPTGNYIKIFTRKFFRGNNLTSEYYFGNKLSRLYQQSFRKRIGFWKMSALATAWGITIDDNSGTSAYLYRFNGQTPAELKSPFFWTVFTESGIKLFSSYRTGANAGTILDSQILGAIQNAQTANNYQGETGADYTISADVSILEPVSIDSALKSAARNKENSADNIIIFQSGLDIDPGQWVQWGTSSYIVLSRRYDSTVGMSVYTAALESNTSYTFSAAAVTPDVMEYDRKNPRGFINRTDSSISYNLASRTVTISGTFEYYYQGRKYIKTAVTESVTHAATVGQYFIYYNGETLVCSAVNTSWDILTDTPVVLVYYNGTAATTNWSGPEAILFEERHGCGIDVAVHKWEHFNVGTYIPGSGYFGLSGLTTGSGADITYGVASGYIADEDIETYIAALADNGGTGNQYPVFYRSGASTEWRWVYAAKPCLFTGATPYYNQLTGGSYQLTAISANNTFFNLYLCAVPFLATSSGGNVSYRFIWILGNNTYSSLSAAQAVSIKTDVSLTGFPGAELRPLYQITMKYATAAGGTTTIEGYQDIMSLPLQLAIGATGGTSDHNQLSNRSLANQHPASAITDVYNVPSLWVRDEKSNGTNAGTFTSGSYVTRTLNTTLKNTITGASLSSNQITLPSGTYYVYAVCPAYACGNHKCKIYNVTDSTDSILGIAAYNIAAGSDAGQCEVYGFFTITSQKVIELRHRCSTTKTDNGLGVAAALGDTEVYAQLIINKIA